MHFFLNVSVANYLDVAWHKLLSTHVLYRLPLLNLAIRGAGNPARWCIFICFSHPPKKRSVTRSRWHWNCGSFLCVCERHICYRIGHTIIFICVTHAYAASWTDNNTIMYMSFRWHEHFYLDQIYAFDICYSSGVYTPQNYCNAHT